LVLLGYGFGTGLALLAISFISFSSVGHNSTLVQSIGFTRLFLPWLLVIWPSAALVCKRLHDMNWSGLHSLWLVGLWSVQEDWLPGSLAVICNAAGIVAGLWMILVPGTPAPNRFGLRAGMKVIGHPSAAPHVP
jgi:uncharacterized membrane protein YhaH (DUF805 family)